jgi:hypothetical protein
MWMNRGGAYNFPDLRRRTGYFDLGVEFCHHFVIYVVLRSNLRFVFSVKCISVDGI